MSNRTITIIGLGGVGGYFGFKIAQKVKESDHFKITFVARGETYHTVKRNGLKLISPEHLNSVIMPDNLVERLTDIPESDLIIICVKEYDLESVCNQIKEKVNLSTVLLPLMNGADIYERIRKIIQSGVVLPACVYVASHIKEKGIVEHKGATGRIIVGNDPQHKDFKPEWVVNLLKESGADILYKENPFVDIWTKFFFIASFGLVSARFNKSIGQVHSEADLKARAIEIMQEIRQIATAKGINLPEDIIEQTFQKASTFPYDTPTSLQLDIQSKKENNELELFAGAIMNYGKQLDIPVEATERIYQEIVQLH